VDRGGGRTEAGAGGVRGVPFPGDLNWISAGGGQTRTDGRAEADGGVGRPGVAVWGRAGGGFPVWEGNRGCRDAYWDTRGHAG